jgi:transcriptional regulator with XRE-family HTH domain
MVAMDVLRRARLAGGFTLREVSGVVKVDPSTIVSYELGRGRPSQATALRWHDALIRLLEERTQDAASAVATLKEMANAPRQTTVVTTNPFAGERQA